MTNLFHVARLIARHLSGKTDETEEAELTRWRNESAGNEGPLWYRGLVRTDEKYNPIKSKDLKKILKRYTVERIIVGHTIFDDISSFHGGRVIDVNVDNKKNQEEKRGRGLLIDGDDYLVVGDEGVQRNINEARSPGRRQKKDPIR